MKKRLFITLLMVALFVCLFAISVSASEFGNITTIENMTVVNGLDTTSRVLMTDGITYPSAYIFKNLKDIDFSALNTAAGKSYDSSSVVMIEYPEGCTYVSRTFAGSTTLEYVYFSSTITGVQWGTFLSTTSLTEVEFAENSTITAMNTDCFANTGIEVLKLPNSLRTVNDNFLRSCGNLTTVYFGENFTQVFDINAFFAGCNNLKTIYMPAGNFDENGNIALHSNFFGWNDRDSAFRTGGVIYYTGTKTQAQKIIDTELELYTAKNESTAVWNTIQLVSLDEFNAISADEKSSKCYMVYEYNKCDAFYNGEHKFSSDYKLNFVDFTTSFNEVGECSVCKIQEKVNEEDYAPIFVFAGYSVKENDNTALCGGYTVNHKSLEVYKKYNSNISLEYGMVAATPNADGSNLLKIGENGVEAAQGRTNIIIANVNMDYVGYDFILRGFDEEGGNSDTALIICSYVSDGTNIYYLTKTCSSTVPAAITMTEIRKKQQKDTE